MSSRAAFVAQNPRWHRLSALDAAFLAVENRDNPLHIGATALFEPGSSIDGSGRLDEARYLRFMRAVLGRLPKWRWRLTRVPLLHHPVLVPDPGFDIRRHVRFVHLSAGSFRDVEDLAADSYSRLLDRDRPLWEQLVVDGLEGGRFAIIVKLHHCMSDGVAGLGALASMLSGSADDRIPDCADERFEPPTPRELLSLERERRAAEPRLLWDRARAFLADGKGARERSRSMLHSIASGVRAVRPAPATPLNPRWIGPRRAYRSVRLELDEVKRVARAAAGAKLNDVVLATVAGALQSYCQRHGVALKEPLRCMVPVSMRASGSTTEALNEVSLMVVPLPHDSKNPRERLERILAQTSSAKRDHQSNLFAAGEELAEWTFAPLIPWAVRLVIALRPINVIVTNIPGPPFPLYLLDSRLVGIHPMVPLYGNQALGIALVSYDGGLYWGLSADSDRITDLDTIADAIRRSFDELRAAYPG